MDHISSRQNTHFKLARKLAGSARERAKTDQILLDGTRLIGAYAAQCGLKESTLLISEKGFSRPEVQQILQSASPRHAFVLPEELFAEISQVETPEGIAAIVGIPSVEARLPDDFRIVLDGVQDPGNLGGLLRTAAAAGATSAHLAKGCADPWSPRSLRGGMGAQFVLPLRERIDIQIGLAGFNGEVIATSPRARQSIYELDLTGPVAMIFGSEGRGIADETLGLVSQLVHIPMTGMMESLNVAAAAAVCCFERLRQRDRSKQS
ncbi:MAG: RNA methyltransferase [Betaproteobacteria bacterium]|jgi:TrmH family RNA methyltransferase